MLNIKHICKSEHATNDYHLQLHEELPQAHKCPTFYILDWQTHKRRPFPPLAG